MSSLTCVVIKLILCVFVFWTCFFFIIYVLPCLCTYVFFNDGVCFSARRLSSASCGALAPSCGASRTAASPKLCCGTGRACARNNWCPNRSSHTSYSCMYFILTYRTERRSNTGDNMMVDSSSLLLFEIHAFGNIIAVQVDALFAASAGCFSEV